MRRTSRKFTVVGLLCFLCCSAWAQKVCFTLGKDKNGSCLDSTCEVFCAESVTTKAALNPFVPGFFLEPSKTGYSIAAVIPKSPAFAAGLIPGDQIISVDGKRLPLFCPVGSELWQAGGTHELAVLHEGKVQVKNILPDSLSHVVAAAFGIFANTSDRDEVLTQPYLSGVLAEIVRGRLVVSAVLRGTVAEQVGILPGDEIIEVNGQAVQPKAALRVVQGGDHKALLHLGVTRAGAALSFQLENNSLMEVLRRLANGAEATKVSMGGAL
jgi:membrane-associated protease RseP (regulator of RpoE activity)